MQAFAPDAKASRLSLIWLGDPAVADDPPAPRPPEGRDETPEEKAAREAWRPPSEVYERTLDRKALTFTGEPRCYVMRPLRPFERAAFSELTFGGAQLNYLAYVVMGTALIEVTGPHPVGEDAIRRCRTRDSVTGLDMVPRGSALWDDLKAFPPSALWETTILYMKHQGNVTTAAGSEDAAARQVDPGN